MPTSAVGIGGGVRWHGGELCATPALGISRQKYFSVQESVMSLKFKYKSSSFSLFNRIVLKMS